MENSQRHGAQYETAGAYGPEAVAASLARGDGGFGRNQETYFDHPVLRKAHWRWQIVLYFFVGGASAASAALSSIADLSGDPGDRQLVRNGRYTALAGAALSSLLLVSDLGRPERFLKMLRIAKLKSPMSVGVYTLVTFSMTAALAALEQFHIDGHIAVDPIGWIPKRLRLAVSSIAAAYLACYTAVLITATAIPVWYTGRRHIPPIFVLSAMSTGSAMQSILLAIGGPSPRTMKKLETIELVASLAEASLLLNFERHAGDVGRPLFRGVRGKRLKTFTMGLGIALPALINLPSIFSRKPAHKPHRFRTLLTSALVLAGGYVLRESVIGAGRDSADDPRAYLRHPE